MLENTGQRENVHYKPLLNLWRFIYFCSQMTNIDFPGFIVEPLSSEPQPPPFSVPSQTAACGRNTWTEVSGAGEHASGGLSGPGPQTGPGPDPSAPTQTAATAHRFHLTSSPPGSVMSGGVRGRRPPGKAAEPRAE